MIRNEHEYQVSKAYQQRLMETRAGYAAHPNADPTQREWLAGGVDNLLSDVEAEFTEYEELLTSQADSLHPSASHSTSGSNG